MSGIIAVLLFFLLRCKFSLFQKIMAWAYVRIFKSIFFGLLFLLALDKRISLEQSLTISSQKTFFSP